MIEKVMDSPRYMWSLYDTSDLFLTTTNSTVNVRSGALVMGAGHAKQTRDRFRGVDKALAHYVQQNAIDRVYDKTWKDVASFDTERGGKVYRVFADYYLLVSENWPKKKLGAFQVKRGFWMGAPEWTDLCLQVVNQSAMALKVWCIAHPYARVDMPFPGIGNGGLDREQVYPLIKDLPDTVYVWRLE